ncbi:MAG: ribosome silencing factor [Lachnospiraceae bacterium]|nr:ribosome silencing factor [Lachnospiraceae bacterium]
MDEMIKLIYKAIDDKKGKDIRIIDIAEVSSIADYFVIASGDNTRQVQAIVDNITEVLGRAGYNYKSMEGYESATWILLDYYDVIIHVFNNEDRRFYDLERIWRDGKTKTIEEFK